MKQRFIQDEEGDIFAIDQVMSIKVDKVDRKSMVVVRFTDSTEWEYPCYSRANALEYRDQLIAAIEADIIDLKGFPKAKHKSLQELADGLSNAAAGDD